MANILDQQGSFGKALDSVYRDGEVGTYFGHHGKEASFVFLGSHNLCTDQFPLKQVFDRLKASERMAKWALELRNGQMGLRTKRV